MNVPLELSEHISGCTSLSAFKTHLFKLAGGKRGKVRGKPKV